MSGLTGVRKLAFKSNLIAQILARPTSRGIFFMLSSTIIFSLTHVAIREASAHTPPIQVAFLRNLFAMMLILPLMYRYGWQLWQTTQFSVHCIRAIFHVVAMFSFFTAVGITPLAKVTALGYTAPIFAAILSVLFFGERFRIHRWSAIFFGFLGAIVILRPGLIEIDLGSFLVLFSSCLWGITLVIIKLLSKKDSSITIAAYMSLLGTLISALPAWYVWKTPELYQWPILILVAILSTIGQLALTEGLKNLDTTVAMPFDYLRLIWAAFFGFLFFSEVPDTYIWIGAIMICSSGIWIAYRENIQNKADAIQNKKEVV